MKPAVYVFVFAVLCAGCNRGQPEQALAPAAAATVAPAASQAAPGASASADVAPADAELLAKGPYLFDLLQRPDYSKAFEGMAGAEQLPDWARLGGTSTPVQKVTIEGRAMLVANGCKPHDCPTERIVLLFDEKSHTLWGLFARRPAGKVPVDMSDSTNDELTWLGEPDEAMQALLKKKLYSP
jgi:hypothetical protein